MGVLYSTNQIYAEHESKFCQNNETSRDVNWRIMLMISNMYC